MSTKSYEAENTRADLIDGTTEVMKKLSSVMGEVQSACIKCQNLYEVKERELERLFKEREQQIEKLQGDYMSLLDQTDGLREENEKLTKELSLRKEYK